MSSGFTSQTWMDETRHPGWMCIFFFCTHSTRQFGSMWSKGHFETSLCPREKCLMISYPYKALKHITPQRKLTEPTPDAFSAPLTLRPHFKHDSDWPPRRWTWPTNETAAGMQKGARGRGEASSAQRHQTNVRSGAGGSFMSSHSGHVHEYVLEGEARLL